MLPHEEWRPIAGWEGLYEVSDQGRVRSLPRQTARGVRGGKIISGRPDPKGYIDVQLRNAPYRPGQNYQLHRLVLEAFVGPCPEGFITRHYPDYTPSNCRLGNLSWASRKQNALDAIEAGAQPRGERHGASKLTDAETATLIAERNAGAKLTVLAGKYGISFQHVSLIARGKRRGWASQ
jgi:hypothetical protein